MPRKVLDSGEAFKIVYMSQAPLSWTEEQLEEQLDKHKALLRKELQAGGRLVRGIFMLPYGAGDVKLVARWEILGEKRKHRA